MSLDPGRISFDKIGEVASASQALSRQAQADAETYRHGGQRLGESVGEMADQLRTVFTPGEQSQAGQLAVNLTEAAKDVADAYAALSAAHAVLGRMAGEGHEFLRRAMRRN